MARLFGTDGVRGVANTSELSPELTFALGHAAATLAKTMGQTGAGAPWRPQAVLGRDTRRSGHLLEAALAAGIMAAGGDVRLLGVATTPAVAYLTHSLGADFGVVISASHNPAEYNGIKFFSRDGYKLPDDIEDQLEAMARADARTLPPRPDGAGVGAVVASHGLLDRYVEAIIATAPVRLDGLKIVVDAGHGAAYQLAPAVLERLGARVTIIGNAPDGMNINAGCGSTHPDGLRQAVLQAGAHAGIAHDGDADRCIAVDDRGEWVGGDHILAICGLDLQAQGRLAGDVIVATVMSNMGLEILLREHGIRLLRTKVGDRYVLEQMLATAAVLGGEQSGHVIFGSHSTTGDGILTAVQLLTAAVRAGRPLSELAGKLRTLPQVLENVTVRARDGWEQNGAIATALQQAAASLAGRGRVLVRPSGTEPLIRVMVEGEELSQIQGLAQDIAQVIRAQLGFSGGRAGADSQ